ncbi:hypothetical protein N7517_009271 [Penicillium concentricum]|uniref:Uncharacterized protein n=1 Tax=Penicillium concentricum TaxID=293559 RepID=A0A9W9RH30_9EURO|nr:uncharacterized protein N7517_009271 [Penicillium concentricum]KAJ5360080.1 hypothetical protein N7517_009271 [Penicillium concentricum]
MTCYGQTSSIQTPRALGVHYQEVGSVRQVSQSRTCPFSRDYHANDIGKWDESPPSFLSLLDFFFPSLRSPFLKFSHTRGIRSLHILLKTAVFYSTLYDTREYPLMYVPFPVLSLYNAVAIGCGLDCCASRKCTDDCAQQTRYMALDRVQAAVYDAKPFDERNHGFEHS